MKVFNLGCKHEHRFEGWFASADDYEKQLANGLLECPVCGDRGIRKLLSAPRLNLLGTQQEAGAAAAAAASGHASGKDGAVVVNDGAAAGNHGAQVSATAQQLQAMWMKLARHLVESTEDVGESFAEEARRIHYQEAPERGIRGVATAEEREALNEEGIEVFSFPLPRALKDPIQ